MPGNNRKWFWAAVAAWVLSLAAMLAAKQYAAQAMMRTAQAVQARHDGAADGEDSKIFVSRCVRYADTFDTISLVLVALMLAAS